MVFAHVITGAGSSTTDRIPSGHDEGFKPKRWFVAMMSPNAGRDPWVFIFSPSDLCAEDSMTTLGVVRERFTDIVEDSAASADGAIEAQFPADHTGQKPDLSRMAPLILPV